MRCGIVGMKTRSFEANPGKAPTIAHVPMEIVHLLPPAEDDFEKVPGKPWGLHDEPDHRR